MKDKNKVLLTLLLLLVGFIVLWQGGVRQAQHNPLPLPTPAVDMNKLLGIVPVKDKVDICKHDLSCSVLAEAVVYEARGERLIGQYAVASVILNRVDSPRWKNTVKGVVYAPYQFSYVKDRQHQKKPSKKDWTTAFVVAYDLLHGKVERITDADHYFNPNAVEFAPRWASVYKYVMTIDNHVFFKWG